MCEIVSFFEIRHQNYENSFWWRVIFLKHPEGYMGHRCAIYDSSESLLSIYLGNWCVPWCVRTPYACVCYVCEMCAK